MGESFYKSQQWLETRYEALRRSKGHCLCCGCRGTPENPLQVDHIKPRSKFPELALQLDNLQVLCHNCNMGKGNLDYTSWDNTGWKQTELLLAIEGAWLGLRTAEIHFAQKPTNIMRYKYLTAKVRFNMLQERTDSNIFDCLFQTVQAKWVSSNDLRNRVIQ